MSSSSVDRSDKESQVVLGASQTEATMPQEIQTANADMTKPAVQDTFRFFELPPELRDMVYRYLETNFTQIHPSVPVLAADANADAEDEEEYVLDQFYVCMIPPHFCEVSREFKAEVDRQMVMYTTLVFEATETESLQAHACLRQIPTAALNLITRVELTLEAWCDVAHTAGGYKQSCDAAIDINNQQPYVGHLLAQMPRLKICEIDLTVWCEKDDNLRFPNAKHAPGFMRSLQNLVRTDGVTTLRVYKDRNQQKTLWATCNRGIGWVAPR